MESHKPERSEENRNLIGREETEGGSQFTFEYHTRILNLKGSQGTIIDSVTGSTLDNFSFSDTDNGVFHLDGNHVLFNNGSVCNLRGEVVQELSKLSVQEKWIKTLPEPKRAFYTQTAGELNKRYSLFDPFAVVTHVVAVDDTDPEVLNVFTWDGRKLKFDHKFKFKATIKVILPFPGDSSWARGESGSKATRNDQKVIVKFDKAFVIYDIGERERVARIDMRELEEFYDVIPLPDGRIGTFVSIGGYTYDAVYIWNLETKEKKLIGKSVGADFQGLWILNDPDKDQEYIVVFARSQAPLKIIRGGASYNTGDSNLMVNIFLGSPEDPDILFDEKTEAPLFEPPPEEEEKYRVKSLLEHTGQRGEGKEVTRTRSGEADVVVQSRQVLKLPHNINTQSVTAHYLPGNRYLVKYSWSWGEGFFLLGGNETFEMLKKLDVPIPTVLLEVIARFMEKYSLLETLRGNVVPLPRSDEQVSEMTERVRELKMPIPTVLSDLIAGFI